jgi:hypothetical protein
MSERLAAFVADLTAAEIPTLLELVAARRARDRTAPSPPPVPRFRLSPEAPGRRRALEVHHPAGWRIWIEGEGPDLVVRAGDGQLDIRPVGPNWLKIGCTPLGPNPEDLR